MRLSYSNIICLFLLMYTPLKEAKAQEQFLKLDSIVVIEDELNILTTGYNNATCEGRDTINIPIGLNQYIQVRKVSFSIRSSSNVAIGFNDGDVDLSIGTESNLFLDLGSTMLKWTSSDNNSASNFRSELLEPKSIKLETYPDEFYSSAQEVFINYDNRYASWNMHYRIELIYYSYE